MSWRTSVAVLAVLLFGSMATWGCDSQNSDKEATGQDIDANDVSDARTSELSPTETTSDLGIPTEDPYTGTPGAMASFDLAPKAFFDLPFPIDSRRKAGGRPNLDGFPNPYKIALVDQYIQKAEDQLDGFSPNTTVYFRFDAALNKAQFPSLQKSLQADSSVQLINVTAGSSRFGEHIPLEIFYWDKEAPIEGYYLEPYLLMARPLGGFPLAPGETYACVVLRTMTDATGKNLGASPDVQEALVRGQGPAAKLLAPLREWILQSDPFSVWDVAVATVFTVANPTSDLFRVAKFLKEEPRNWLATSMG